MRQKLVDMQMKRRVVPQKQPAVPQEQRTVRQKLVDMQIKRRVVPQERPEVQRKQKITLREIKTQQSIIMKKH